MCGTEAVTHCGVPDHLPAGEGGVGAVVTVKDLISLVLSSSADWGGTASCINWHNLLYFHFGLQDDMVSVLL